MYAKDAASCRFHVIDTMTDDFSRRVLNNAPFETLAEAEAERLSLNIAGDCVVAYKLRSGSFRVSGEDGWPSA